MPYDNDNIKLRYKAALGHLLYVGCPKADVFVFSGRCGALRFEVCKTSELPAKGTVFGTFCGVQKVPQKHAEGCDPLDSRGRFKSPLDTWLSLK